MTDLPAKDEIVERVFKQYLGPDDWCAIGLGDVREILDALTTRDLLALLGERGIEAEKRYQPISGKPYWQVRPIPIEDEPTIYKHLGIDKPDAVS